MNPALFHQLARQRTGDRLPAGGAANAAARQAMLSGGRRRRRWSLWTGR